MSNLKTRFSDRVIAVLLTVLMIIGTMPLTVLASAQTEIVTDLGKTYITGVATEFYVKSNVADKDVGTMVLGSYSFSDSSAVEKIEYLESKNGQWYTLPGDTFGPATGYPLTDGATSRFRVTFNKTGNFTCKISICKVSDKIEVCSTEQAITVQHTSAELSTDISDKEFVVGEPMEFTFSTKPNDDAGVMVVGSSDFSDADALEKLEYYEVSNGQWYTLSGDFGPATGFPMAEATSRFRATFKKAGSYTFTASMKYADGNKKGEVLCSANVDFKVKDKFDVTIGKNEGGTVTFDNEAVTSAKVTEGTEHTLAVAAVEGYAIAEVSVNNAAQTVADSNKFETKLTVDKNTEIKVSFVKIYSVTVKCGENGTVTTAPESTGGSVKVTSGTNVTVTATPNKNYRVQKVVVNGTTIGVWADNTYADVSYKYDFNNLSADSTIEITFAPKVYNVKVEDTVNGTVEPVSSVVNHDTDAVLTIKPADGYVIDTVKINDSSAINLVKETDDDNVFTLSVTGITEDKNVEVAFKQPENVNSDDEGVLAWNAADALRTDDNTYIFKSGTKITFSTEMQGLRITDGTGKVYGDKATNRVVLNSNVVLKKIEVRYDFGWHEVLFDGKSADIAIKYDTGKPVIGDITTEENANENGYFNADFGINFVVEDEGDWSGIASVKYTVECDGKQTKEEEIFNCDKDNSIIASKKFEKIAISAAENNSENVKITVTAIDRAGNEADKKEATFKVCTDTPQVSIAFENNKSAEASGSWYNSDRTATIKITDRADVFDGASAKSGFAFAEGSETKYKVSDWVNEGNTHTATVTFASEGEYREISYSYTNMASVDAAVTITGEDVSSFGIDKNKPTGSLVVKSADWEGGIDWQWILNKITFGLYSKNDTSVTVKDGSDALSGIKEIKYYASNAEDVLAESNLDAIYADNKFGSDEINKTIDAQFAVYARLVDNAGNVTYLGTNGIICDKTASDITITLPNKANEQYGSADIKSYNVGEEKINGIEAKISVKESDSDIYSGIKSVTYEVVNGRSVTQSGTLFEFKNDKPEKKDLANKFDGTVYIDAEKNNADGIKLIVTVTDNAGNESVKEYTFDINIDKVTATVTASGTPVTVSDGYGWFNSERTVTVVINDRDSSFADKTPSEVIKITKKDKNGNPVEVTSDDVTISEKWTSRTAVISFKGDGIYSWKIDYTNKAGNTLTDSDIAYVDSVSPAAFTVDREKPTGTITISERSWADKIVETLTFGAFSKNAFEVKSSSDDTLSPIKTEYYRHSGNNALNEGELEALYNGGAFSAELPELKDDGQYAVYMRVTDNAGNFMYVSSDGHVIDNVSSTLSLSAVDEASDNGIYNIDDVAADDAGKPYGVRIAVSAKEGENTDSVYSGIKSVVYEVTSGGSVTQKDEFVFDSDAPTKDQLAKDYNGIIVVDPDKNNRSDVNVKVTVTDNSGNITEENIKLDIDITSPEISVSYDNNTAANDKYFNAKRTATVVYTERSDHFSSAAAEENIKITAKDLAGNDIADAYTISWTDRKNADDPNKDTHTATISYNADANYTFEVSYTDNAGNKNADVKYNGSVAPTDFAVDTTAPVGEVKINDSVWNEADRLLEKLTFGLYSNKKATVKASANDATSPVKIEYFKSNSDTPADTSALKYESGTEFMKAVNKNLYEIEKTEQFNVYVKVTDKAGNSILLNTDGFVVDLEKSPVSLYAVTKANSDGIYGTKEVEADKGVKLHYEANDTLDGNNDVYSGIKTVTYTVSAEINGQTVTTVPETTLFAFDNKAPEKKDLVTEYSGDIIVKADENNSSKVTVKVTVTDNAGNVNTAENVLDIDITSPTIDITYDNNTALNEKYFGAKRTAKVVITERANHFNSVAATNGIKITAVDANGETVEDAFRIGGFTTETHGDNPDKTTHTAEIYFEKDANYTLSVSYTDAAGNANEKVNTADSVAPYEFTVDTLSPEAEVSINEHIWDKILNVLTFGLFSKVKGDVKAETSDKTSPYSTEYYITNDPIVKTADVLDKLYGEGKFKQFDEFTVNTNEQFVVYVRVADKAGNYKYISTDGFIVDLKGPNVTLVPDEPNENKVYNRDVNIKIAANDDEPYSGIAKIEYWVMNGEKETQRQTLYSFDYTREEGENCNKGTLNITDWASGKEEKQTLTGNVPTQAQLKSSWNGSITVDASLNDSSDVEVFVGVTDNAGNYTEQKVALDIDITDPVINVKYDSQSNKNAIHGYYTSRTATVSITERTGHFDAAKATNGIKITAVDAKGNAVANAYTISTWTTVEGATPDDAVHTATISYTADANYTFAISYTDKADNENVPVVVNSNDAPYAFTVDKTAPTGTVTAVSAEGRKETWSSVVDELTFGFWSNTKISLSGTSDDATSPVQSVEYYMPVSELASDNTEVLKNAELDKITDWKSFSEFAVTENTQFTVYLKITDNAGNYTYVSTNGLIVDEEHPVEESVAPEITVSPVQPVNGIYNGDVKVKIEVVDPMVGGTYSGLKNVSYAVYDRDSATPDVPTQQGTLFKFDKAYPKQSELEQKYTGEITVEAAKNNSNNIQIVVSATDNSLNFIDNSQKEAKSYTVIKIDTTAPVINISYDNNNVDSGSYFKANRTATIVVTERNFNANDVKVTVTNTDGTVPAVVGWSDVTGELNGDTSTHTAKISYASDGDYTFAIEYTDLAGNKCSSVSYGSSVAPTAFTVDKTIPTVSVTYDNNSALNSNYYNGHRTATVVIREHNFSADRVKIAMTATNDGAASSVPAVNGWTSDGDVHTATISFVNDSLYSFDIDFTDLAGNVSADYNADSFYVDTTAPSLEITGVLDMSANNGEVIPIVSYSDTNFDSNGVKITLIGVNRQQVTPVGVYAETHNGQVFTFADFEHEQDVDDIYTLTAALTDRAGNSTTKTISFSVNRFGSTYQFGGENNTYVKKANDIVVTETNANELSNIKITLFKNNETIVLKQGTDYKIDVTGGDGQWYKYVYTIFSKVFADDGVYRLSFHSEDAAGNVAENTLDTKDAEISFGVDATPPTIHINNISSGTTYALDKLTALISVADNLSLAKVSVSLDGGEATVYEGDSLKEIINNGGTVSFDIPGDSTEAHTLKITAVDAAGNEYTEEVSDFYVTTNLWVRFYNNKAVFYGTIIGILLLIAIIVFIVVWRRRKKEEADKK